MLLGLRTAIKQKKHERRWSSKSRSRSEFFARVVRSNTVYAEPSTGSEHLHCAPPVLTLPRHGMSESSFVVQKVEWYQFRDPSGHAFFVMVASLPNGFFTAVPCQVTMRLADHSLIALAPTQDEALNQLQTTLAGKTVESLFPTA